MRWLRPPRGAWIDKNLACSASVGGSGGDGGREDTYNTIQYTIILDLQYNTMQYVEQDSYHKYLAVSSTYLHDSPSHRDSEVQYTQTARPGKKGQRSEAGPK